MRPTPAVSAAGLGDPRIDLRAGQLAAFAGLGALGHLDLEFAGVGEVLARDAEAAGGHLLDGGVLGVAVGHRARKRVGILAAFAGVGSCRRCGSSRWRASRGLRWRWSRRTWRRS